MKYSWLFFLGLLLYSCGSDKATPTVLVSRTSELVSVKNDVILLNNKPFDGFLYELYPNSQDTASIESYSKGVLHGITKKWYPNGHLMEMRHYHNGQKNGQQISWWENGNKRFEFVAAEDKYEGELKEWNVSGSLIHLATYKNGQEEGTQKMWYDNGKIRANYVMRNGKRYGLLGTKNCKNVSDSVFVSM